MLNASVFCFSNLLFPRKIYLKLRRVFLEIIVFDLAPARSPKLLIRLTRNFHVLFCIALSTMQRAIFFNAVIR